MPTKKKDPRNKKGQFTTEVKKTKDDSRLEGKKSVGQLVLEAQEALREEGRQEVEIKWAESEKRLADYHLVAIAQIRKEHLEEMERSAGMVRAIIEEEKAKAYHEGMAKGQEDLVQKCASAELSGVVTGRKEGYAAGIKAAAKEKFIGGLVIGWVIAFIAAFIAIQFR